jgi:hypothetical protein
VLCVWPDLLDAVATFQRCQINAIAGMTLQWLGISATEIRNALTLARIPRARWLEVSDDVSHMGLIAAQAMNQRVSPST